MNDLPAMMAMTHKNLKKLRKAFERGKLSQINGLLLKMGSPTLIDPKKWFTMKNPNFKVK